MLSCKLDEIWHFYLNSSQIFDDDLPVPINTNILHAGCLTDMVPFVGNFYTVLMHELLPFQKTFKSNT